jgi:signal transduction histidine kinase
VNILNIVKEALNNVRKHAEADSVTIVFSTAQDELCITMEDDGKGFDVALHGNNTDTGFGLSIMRERASEIGARLDIQSVLGKGSCVVLCVPIKEERKNANEGYAGR